jgi:galactokinase
VAGVVAVLRPAEGGRGRATTTLPLGGGLSSSAALEVAVALALGAASDDPDALATLCQQAEQVASGVPCGVMDQLACAAGIPGHALLIDCSTMSRRPVTVPASAQILVAHSGQPRALATSAYAERRREVEAAADALGGPLHDAAVADVATLGDERLRRRARHVVTENARVRAFAAALEGDDLETAGRLMTESHASLRADFEVSTPRLDALVDALCESPGVFGARLTGAGFGGCVVALAAPGVAFAGARAVHASAGASVRVVG